MTNVEVNSPSRIGRNARAAGLPESFVDHLIGKITEAEVNGRRVKRPTDVDRGIAALTVAKAIEGAIGIYAHEQSQLDTPDRDALPRGGLTQLRPEIAVAVAIDARGAEALLEALGRTTSHAQEASAGRSSMANGDSGLTTGL